MSNRGLSSRHSKRLGGRQPDPDSTGQQPINMNSMNRKVPAILLRPIKAPDQHVLEAAGQSRYSSRTKEGMSIPAPELTTTNSSVQNQDQLPVLPTHVEPEDDPKPKKPAPKPRGRPKGSKTKRREEPTVEDSPRVRPATRGIRKSYLLDGESGPDPQHSSDDSAMSESDTEDDDSSTAVSTRYRKRRAHSTSDSDAIIPLSKYLMTKLTKLKQRELNERNTLTAADKAVLRDEPLWQRYRFTLQEKEKAAPKLVSGTVAENHRIRSRLLYHMKKLGQHQAMTAVRLNEQPSDEESSDALFQNLSLSLEKSANPKPLIPHSIPAAVSSGKEAHDRAAQQALSRVRSYGTSMSSPRKNTTHGDDSDSDNDEHDDATAADIPPEFTGIPAVLSLLALQKHQAEHGMSDDAPPPPKLTSPVKIPSLATIRQKQATRANQRTRMLNISTVAIPTSLRQGLHGIGAAGDKSSIVSSSSAFVGSLKLSSGMTGMNDESVQAEDTSAVQSAIDPSQQEPTSTAASKATDRSSRNRSRASGDDSKSKKAQPQLKSNQPMLKTQDMPLTMMYANFKPTTTSTNKVPPVVSHKSAAAPHGKQSTDSSHQTTNVDPPSNETPQEYLEYIQSHPIFLRVVEAISVPEIDMFLSTLTSYMTTLAKNITDITNSATMEADLGDSHSKKKSRTKDNHHGGIIFTKTLTPEQEALRAYYSRQFRLLSRINQLIKQSSVYTPQYLLALFKLGLFYSNTHGLQFVIPQLELGPAASEDLVDFLTVLHSSQVYAPAWISIPNEKRSNNASMGTTTTTSTSTSSSHCLASDVMQHLPHIQSPEEAKSTPSTPAMTSSSHLDGLTCSLAVRLMSHPQIIQELLFTHANTLFASIYRATENNSVIATINNLHADDLVGEIIKQKRNESSLPDEGQQGAQSSYAIDHSTLFLDDQSPIPSTLRTFIKNLVVRTAIAAQRTTTTGRHEVPSPIHPAAGDLARFALTSSQTIQTKYTRKQDTIALNLYQSRYMQLPSSMSNTLGAILKSHPPALLNRGLRLLEVLLSANHGAVLTQLIAGVIRDVTQPLSSTPTTTLALDGGRDTLSMDNGHLLNKPAKPLQQPLIPLAVKLRRGFSFDGLSVNNRRQLLGVDTFDGKPIQQYAPIQPSPPEVYDGIVMDIISYQATQNLLSSYRSRYAHWYHTLNSHIILNSFNVQQHLRQKWQSSLLRKNRSSLSPPPSSFLSPSPSASLPIVHPVSYGNIVWQGGPRAMDMTTHVNAMQLDCNKSHLCLYGAGCKSDILLDFLNTTCQDGPVMFMDGMLYGSADNTSFSHTKSLEVTIHFLESLVAALTPVRKGEDEISSIERFTTIGHNQQHMSQIHAVIEEWHDSYYQPTYPLNSLDITGYGSSITHKSPTDSKKAVRSKSPARTKTGGRRSTLSSARSLSLSLQDLVKTQRQLHKVIKVNPEYASVCAVSKLRKRRAKNLVLQQLVYLDSQPKIVPVRPKPASKPHQQTAPAPIAIKEISSYMVKILAQLKEKAETTPEALTEREQQRYNDKNLWDRYEFTIAQLEERKLQKERLLSQGRENKRMRRLKGKNASSLQLQSGPMNDSGPELGDDDDDDDTDWTSDDDDDDDDDGEKKPTTLMGFHVDDFIISDHDNDDDNDDVDDSDSEDGTSESEQTDNDNTHHDDTQVDDNENTDDQDHEDSMGLRSRRRRIPFADVKPSAKPSRPAPPPQETALGGLLSTKKGRVPALNEKYLSKYMVQRLLDLRKKMEASENPRFTDREMLYINDELIWKQLDETIAYMKAQEHPQLPVTKKKERSHTTTATTTNIQSNSDDETGFTPPAEKEKEQEKPEFDHDSTQGSIQAILDTLTPQRFPHIFSPSFCILDDDPLEGYVLANNDELFASLPHTATTDIIGRPVNSNPRVTVKAAGAGDDDGSTTTMFIFDPMNFTPLTRYMIGRLLALKFTIMHRIPFSPTRRDLQLLTDRDLWKELGWSLLVRKYPNIVHSDGDKDKHASPSTNNVSTPSSATMTTTTHPAAIPVSTEDDQMQKEFDDAVHQAFSSTLKEYGIDMNDYIPDGAMLSHGDPSETATPMDQDQIHHDLSALTQSYQQIVASNTRRTRHHEQSGITTTTTVTTTTTTTTTTTSDMNGDESTIQSEIDFLNPFSYHLKTGINPFTQLSLHGMNPFIQLASGWAQVLRPEYSIYAYNFQQHLQTEIQRFMDQCTPIIEEYKSHKLSQAAYLQRIRMILPPMHPSVETVRALIDVPHPSSLHRSVITYQQSTEAATAHIQTAVQQHQEEKQKERGSHRGECVNTVVPDEFDSIFPLPMPTDESSLLSITDNMDDIDITELLSMLDINAGIDSHGHMSDDTNDRQVSQLIATQPHTRQVLQRVSDSSSLETVVPPPQAIIPQTTLDGEDFAWFMKNRYHANWKPYAYNHHYASSSSAAAAAAPSLVSQDAHRTISHDVPAFATIPSSANTSQCRHDAVHDYSSYLTRAFGSTDAAIFEDVCGMCAEQLSVVVSAYIQNKRVLALLTQIQTILHAYTNFHQLPQLSGLTKRLTSLRAYSGFQVIPHGTLSADSHAAHHPFRLYLGIASVDSLMDKTPFLYHVISLISTMPGVSIVTTSNSMLPPSVRDGDYLSFSKLDLYGQNGITPMKFHYIHTPTYKPLAIPQHGVFMHQQGRVVGHAASSSIVGSTTTSMKPGSEPRKRKYNYQSRMSRIRDIIKSFSPVQRSLLLILATAQMNFLNGLLRKEIDSDNVDAAPKKDISDPSTYHGANPGLTPDEWLRLALDQLLVSNVDGFRAQIRELLEQSVVTTAKRAKDNTSRQMVFYYTLPFHYETIRTEIINASL